MPTIPAIKTAIDIIIASITIYVFGTSESSKDTGEATTCDIMAVNNSIHKSKLNASAI